MINMSVFTPGTTEKNTTADYAPRDGEKAFLLVFLLGQRRPGGQFLLALGSFYGGRNPRNQHPLSRLVTMNAKNDGCVSEHGTCRLSNAIYSQRTRIAVRAGTIRLVKLARLR